MRQLTLVNVGQVDWQEVPDPVLTSPAAAIVRPVAVAVVPFLSGRG